MAEKLNTQERLIEIIKLLSEKHVSGMTNKEIAGRIGTTEVNVCRDMALLNSNSFVVQGNGGRWRLSITFGGIAGRIMRSYQEARLRLTEEEAQYAAEMQ